MSLVIKDSVWIGLEPWLLFLLAQCYGCSWTHQIDPSLPVDLSSTLWERMWLEPTSLFLRLIADSSSSLPMIWLLVPPIDPSLACNARVSSWAFEDVLCHGRMRFGSWRGFIFLAFGSRKQICSSWSARVIGWAEGAWWPCSRCSLPQVDQVHFMWGIRHFFAEEHADWVRIFFRLIYFFVVADGKDTTKSQSLCICIVMRRRPLCSKNS